MAPPLPYDRPEGSAELRGQRPLSRPPMRTDVSGHGVHNLPVAWEV